MRLTIRIWRRLRLAASSAVGRTILRLEGITFGERLVLYGVPIVSRAPGSRIALGRDVVLASDSLYTALGVNHAVVLRTLLSGAELVVGDEVGISGGSICAALRVRIGARCLIGANVTITDTDFHTLAPVNRRHVSDPAQISTDPVEIGENVFIGTNATILKGVTIGRNAVIGAGSVVSRDIPDNAVAAGVPCRIIGSVQGRTFEEAR